METNKLYNIDALEGLKSLEDSSIDLIVSDPPYGVEFGQNKLYDDSKETVFNIYSEWLSEMCRVMKDGSHMYLFIPTLEVDKWVYEVKKYFKFNNLIATSVYTTNKHLKNNFAYDLQIIIYASKGNANELNKVDFIKTSDSWLKDKRNGIKNEFTYHYPSFFPKELRANIKPNKKIKALHPNQKNTELLDKLILLSSNEEDVVLDPFLGSGSTLVSAKRNKRNYIGFELNENIFKIAEKRLKET